jgi:hypothetical protein
MLTIPISGIPKGCRVIAIRPPRIGDIVVAWLNCGFDVIAQGHQLNHPRIILEKIYNPGIPIPNGWKVWRNNDGVWGASETGNSVWRICGLQHFPEFVPPPNGISAIVERQS